MRVEGIRFEGRTLVVNLDREFTDTEKASFMMRIRWVLDEMDRVWREIAREGGPHT